jgi:uncharacterized protein YjbI with pentapeptide repeats
LPELLGRTRGRSHAEFGGSWSELRQATRFGEFPPGSLELQSQRLDDSGIFVLAYSNLCGANLNHALIKGDNLLYGADLSDANLNRVTITGDVTGGYKPLQFANLSGANLGHATIGGGPNEFGLLQSANLTGANLEGALITGFGVLGHTNLSGANLHGASVAGFLALSGAFYDNTTCPDGTNSDDDGGTCVGHGVP